ncbi:TetR/AcrR family transcriptional regulator [Syntrophobotulus glycolicus]|nr:TetR/AcrR family transcriptional regulator [Syntrophobotulus glycolicus]
MDYSFCSSVLSFVTVVTEYVDELLMVKAKYIDLIGKMICNIIDLRRNAILNAAFKEFAERGFDEASTNVIAKESGISKGLMFHYVNSKKDL